MDFGVERLSDGGVILLTAVPLGSNGSQATPESLAQPPWAQALVVQPVSTHRLASQPGDGKIVPFGILCEQLLIFPDVIMSEVFSH